MATKNLNNSAIQTAQKPETLAVLKLATKTLIIQQIQTCMFIQKQRLVGRSWQKIESMRVADLDIMSVKDIWDTRTK